MKFTEEMKNNPRTSWLDFGGDPNQNLNLRKERQKEISSIFTFC